MRRRHVDCMEDGSEGLGSLGQLSEAVLHEPIPYNQPERNGSPASEEGLIYSVDVPLFQ